MARASERSQSGATLPWVGVRVAALELGTIVDEKILPSHAICVKTAELSGLGKIKLSISYILCGQGAILIRVKNTVAANLRLVFVS